MKIEIPQSDIDKMKSDNYFSDQTKEIGHFQNGINCCLSKVNERLSPVLDKQEELLKDLNSFLFSYNRFNYENSTEMRDRIFEAISEIKNLTKPE